MKFIKDINTGDIVVSNKIKRHAKRYIRREDRRQLKQMLAMLRKTSY